LRWGAPGGVGRPSRPRGGARAPPRLPRRPAGRATLPAKPLIAEFREPVVSLWLGPNAHLVLYPVRGGDAVNLVAIVRDDWHEPGWSAAGAPEELLAHYRRWPPRLQNLLALPDRWLKWALCDRARLRRWSRR